VSTTIAVLGTGRMGGPIARTLLAAGFDVRVWNRSPAKVEPLAAAGARIAGDPREAVAGAEVVITMLADGRAVEETMLEPGGALSAIAPGAVWIQMGTIGPEWTGRFAGLAEHSGVHLVDAPVSGSDGPAARGELVVLASGPGHGKGHANIRRRIQPVFDALARRTVWIGAVGDGSRFKLLLNSWLVSTVEAAAEAVALAEGLGLDPTLLLDVLEDGPLASPYALDKARSMVEREFTPGFPLSHALKDARLAGSAARMANVAVPLTSAIITRWAEVEAQGHGHDDVASVVDGLLRPEQHEPSSDARAAG
jgi:3-hydroxyisobutyrate dehydrogenase